MLIVYSKLIFSLGDFVFNMSFEIIIWLQNWYSAQCDGEWEHSYGIIIATLDNPGWTVTIDLVGTSLEGKPMDSMSTNRGEDEWMSCAIENKQFKGYGGPNQLKEILTYFRSWVEGC